MPKTLIGKFASWTFSGVIVFAIAYLLTKRSNLSFGIAVIYVLLVALYDLVQRRQSKQNESK
ncbi:hypothetical protein PQ472_04145 [Lacticaseibacillus pabuli]|uniref:Uncharacterized protein n=1 Tax=Lacticaseibacillus pabuli TaxID=3025672 RepID=A0ABY7WWB9_9LACO|nr:hypothetical protein [Lacticaseibacillus sp. KACC 23028]WDF83435.1 hypothetical protein PQ472_04145 [Lacticaseibacillus sp. KACC 23028]